MILKFVPLAALLPLTSFVSAHFQLLYPPARGFDETTLPQFPCGGQNQVSSNRTMWPMNGGPVQLNLQHTATQIQALLGLGNDPGVNFNIVLRPTFQENGPNNFCMGMVSMPAGVNVTAGMNATIQVVTNGDSGPGGLYNCADITFTDTPLSAQQYIANCVNSTGITTSPLTGAAIDANGTTLAASGSGLSASGSASATAASASASSTSGAGANIQLGGWAFGLMGVVGGLMGVV